MKKDTALPLPKNLQKNPSPQSNDNPQIATQGHAYLTYKLDLIKTLAVTIADPLYQKATNLRIKELRLLRLIHDYPNISSSELKVKLVLDKTLLSKHLADLENRGLIEKRLDSSDNRVYRLNLTAKGLDVWQICEKIGCDIEAQMFSELTADEWQQLQHLLDRALTSIRNFQ